MPILTTSPLYRLGLTNQLCPTCGTQLPARVVVNGATVVDVYNEWIEDGREHFEEIRIVCVQQKGN